ncbi:MAG: Trp biosynthesis-associated membrane protein [Mycobacteriales bacterium]|nr:Trp biosynthesis-associated membrane protein [Frankia sp.]
MTADDGRPRRGRRGAGAVAACVCGAALVLLAAGRPWVHSRATRPAPVPGRTDTYLVVPRDVPGTNVFAGVGALGLAALAGSFVAAGTRGRARRVAAVIVATIGVAVAVGAAHAALAATPRAGPATAWPWVAATGGAAAVVGGAVVARRASPRATVGPERVASNGDDDSALWVDLERADGAE